jgi:DNA replication protein DnaC
MHAGMPADVRETLTHIWQLFTLANVPTRGRDFSLAPKPLLTTATFGDEPAGRAELLEQATDYVRSATQPHPARRAGLALTFAVSGAGKSFFLQALEERLRREWSVVTISVTFNMYSPP